MTNHYYEDFVRAVLRDRGSLTRKEISDILGISWDEINETISILILRWEVFEDVAHRLYLEECTHGRKNTGSCRSDPAIYGGIEQVWELEKQLKCSLTNLDSPPCQTPPAPTPTEIRDIEKLYPHRISDEAVAAISRLIDRYVALEAKCKDYDALLADREALHALRAKLRELLEEK